MMTVSTSPALAATDPVVVLDRYGGQRVRWHRTPVEAAIPASAVLVASARGVQCAGWLTDVPDGWVEAARRAHVRIKAAPYADLGALATHQHAGGRPSGPIVPITPGRW